MSEGNNDVLLDRLIHEPARLAILSVLSAVKAADFVFLQRTTGLTKGNLSSHLTKLEEAGLVRIEKTFVRKKPNTSVALTPRSRKPRRPWVWRRAQAIRSLDAGNRGQTPTDPDRAHPAAARDDDPTELATDAGAAQLQAAFTTGYGHVAPADCVASGAERRPVAGGLVGDDGDGAGGEGAEVVADGAVKYSVQA
jgi:DNA-binding transcriptional ArsR family regulator